MNSTHSKYPGLIFCITINRAYDFKMVRQKRIQECQNGQSKSRTLNLSIGTSTIKFARGIETRNVFNGFKKISENTERASVYGGDGRPPICAPDRPGDGKPWNFGGFGVNSKFLYQNHC